MSPLGDKRPQSSFFYIGGDDVSGTSNLTGAYCFVAMGEVLKKYGVTVHEAGRLMVVCYKRYFDAQSKVIRFIRRPGNALAGKTVHGTTKTRLEVQTTSEVEFHLRGQISQRSNFAYQSAATAAIVCRHFLIWLMNTSGFIGALLHSHLWMDMTIASVKKYS